MGQIWRLSLSQFLMGCHALEAPTWLTSTQMTPSLGYQSGMSVYPVTGSGRTDPRSLSDPSPGRNAFTELGLRLPGNWDALSNAPNFDIDDYLSQGLERELSSKLGHLSVHDDDRGSTAGNRRIQPGNWQRRRQRQGRQRTSTQGQSDPRGQRTLEGTNLGGRPAQGGRRRDPEETTTRRIPPPSAHELQSEWGVEDSDPNKWEFPWMVEPHWWGTPYSDRLRVRRQKPERETTTRTTPRRTLQRLSEYPSHKQRTLATPETTTRRGQWRIEDPSWD